MRRVSVGMNLGVIITLGLVLLFGFAQIAPAQTPTPLPLSLDNNYMVTGDYVVGGWTKGPNSADMSTGTITIPDPNAYALNVAPQKVPQGADIVAAFLYWATVENSGVHSGQNGFFSNGIMDNRNNLINYPISGTVLGNPNAPVSWSSGGCAGAANGSKTIVTYRAEVSGLLPVDGNGNAQPNITYTVSLPDTTSPGQPPYTLGATLVIVYRLLAPTVPLTSVVIYDGAFAPSNVSQTMTQPIEGFYQAGNDQPAQASIITKITHIVANGQANKGQQVSLNNYDANGKLVHSTILPSFYNNPPLNPPFPGNNYGPNTPWDDPTWFPNTYATTPVVDTAVQAGESSETTMVVPNGTNKGCVSWGAVIFSTTVQDSDLDGLIDVWKTNQGYYDAGSNRGMSNQGTCTLNQGACIPKANDPAWVSLPGAHTPGQHPPNQDIFIQLDYMCTKVFNNADGTTTCDPSGVSYKPDPVAISNLVSAFSSNGHNIYVHVIPDDKNVISAAQPCADDFTKVPTVYCPYPLQAGVVIWEAGFDSLKTQPLNYVTPSGAPDETSCETRTVGGVAGSGPFCIRRFPQGQNNSYHEVIFGVAIGTPNWDFLDGSLTGVVWSGNTVTFTTSADHGLAQATGPNDTNPNARVSIFNAISNPSLNNTYLVTGVTRVLGNYSFTIQLATSTASPVAYTSTTDPFLMVANGVATARSGISDLGGANSLITLGLWGADGQTVPVESGTFMHELGHSLGLAHGGLYRTDLGGGVPGQLPDNYSFSFEPNCKPNFQSVMNYMFQVDLLDGLLDYSEQDLPTLNESIASTSIPSVLANAIYPTVKWYAPNQAFGTAAIAHCDGTPLLGTDPPSYLLEGPASSITWTLGPGNPLGQDLNFDGQIEAALDGYSDWANIDLRQIGASGNDFWAGGVFPQTRVTGQAFQTRVSGQAFQTRVSGQAFQTRVSGKDIDVQTANAAVRSPKGTSAALTPVNTIQVSFAAPIFGQSQIASFNIYREVNDAGFGKSAFANVPVTGKPLPLPNPLTFTDSSVSCGTYSYFVTTVLSDGRESVSSNTASATPVCSTTVIVTSSVSPSTFGQAVTFTATVTDTTSTATPTGSVQFSIDGTACGGLLPLSGAAAAGSAIATLTVSSASCTTTLAVNGSPHTVKAVYSNADRSFNGSSGTVGQIVNPAPTSTTVISSATPSIYGQSVTFTATVANTSGVSTATPTGSVQFSIDGTACGGLLPLSGAAAAGSTIAVSSASCTTTLAVNGSPHTVKAVYSNTDGNFNGGSGTVGQIVKPAPTSTAVSSSVNPSIFGQSVTFTATVVNTAGAGISTATPTGSVQFMDGAAPLGTAQVVSGSGTVTLTTSTLTVGAHPITAVYSNSDGDFLGNTSAIVNQLVQDFTITVTPRAQTIPSGHQAIYTITVTPMTGLIGKIALSCSGAPPNSTCSVSPSPLTLGGPPVMSTVTLSSNKNVNHGTFTLTITGTLIGSSLSNSTTVQLTVQ